MEQNCKNKLYIGPPGTGKTFRARKEAEKYAQKNERVELISLHSAYGYNNFIYGIDCQVSGKNITFGAVPKKFMEICKEAKKHPNFKWAIILDDINRANISELFGEALSAIENRGTAVTLSNGEQLTVPKNLLIIATFSTVGQSSNIDYAFFRRFDIEYFYSSREKLIKFFVTDTFKGLYIKNDRKEQIFDLITSVCSKEKNNEDIIDKLKDFFQKKSKKRILWNC